VRAVTIVTGTTRVVQSLTAIVSGKILLTLGSLLLVPLYLTHWSPTVYGEWLALSAAVAYLSALDLGMNMGRRTRAATPSSTQPFSGRDWRSMAVSP